MQIKATFCAALFLLSFVQAACNKTQGNAACFKDKCFDVEIVSTKEAMSKGLQFRKGLDENNGMLFIFPKTGMYSFWMKDTIIPLDIIWINQQKEIVYIAKEVQPCLEAVCPSYSPQILSRYVLEINSGLSETLGLKIGQKVSFKIVK